MDGIWRCLTPPGASWRQFKRRINIIWRQAPSAVGPGPDHYPVSKTSVPFFVQSVIFCIKLTDVIISLNSHKIYFSKIVYYCMCICLEQPMTQRLGLLPLSTDGHPFVTLKSSHVTKRALSLGQTQLFHFQTKGDADIGNNELTFRWCHV